MNSKRPKLPLFVIAFMGHILILFILWVIINYQEVQEPVFEKVISVRLTKDVPSHLPPINQAARDKIAEEKRQKEETERRREEAIRKAEQQKRDDAKRKKLADQKKLAEAKKKKSEAETKKQQAAEDAKRKKAEADTKKRAAEAVRQKKIAEDAKRKKAEADRKKRAAEAARQKAAAETARKRQATLGQHANAAISDRVQKEWNSLLFSSLQISDYNDYVKIQITISKTGKVLSAKITKKAKSQTLNSNAQTFFKKITSSSFRFPAFHNDYNKSSITVEYRLRASD